MSRKDSCPIILDSDSSEGRLEQGRKNFFASEVCLSCRFPRRKNGGRRLPAVTHGTTVHLSPDENGDLWTAQH